MESHGLPDMHPKPVTTPKRYGASMAHAVSSIGHVLSCSYCRLLWITMDYRPSWTFKDYPGLSRIMIEYELWNMMDYHGLSWIMDYHGLL